MLKLWYLHQCLWHIFSFKNEGNEVANITYSFDYFFALFYHESRNFWYCLTFCFLWLIYHENCMCRFTIVILKFKDIVYGDCNQDLSPGDAVGSIFKIFSYWRLLLVCIFNDGLNIYNICRFIRSLLEHFSIVSE